MIYRLLYWLQERLPVRCACCGRWLVRKDAEHVHDLILRDPRYLCSDCYQQIYHPWGLL